jgi:hypothetical protein
MPNPFVGYDNIIHLLAPQDIASTATEGGYMDLRNAHKASFLVIFGAITSATTTDEFVISVRAATVDSGGVELPVDFRYRKSGALGTNTWGAVTTVAAATGLGMGADDSDNMMVWIEVDPDALAAANTDYRYVHVLLTDNVDMEACLVTIIGVIEPRYKQTTHISATASASA